LALEIDSRRADRALALAQSAGFTTAEIVQDLAGRDRFLLAARPLAATSGSEAPEAPSGRTGET
jgi:hypothetical protein